MTLNITENCLIENQHQTKRKKRSNLPLEPPLQPFPSEAPDHPPPPPYPPAKPDKPDIFKSKIVIDL